MADRRRQDGKGCDDAPLLLGDDAGFDHGHAAAADVFAEGDADEARFGQLGVGLAVEPVGSGLDLAQAVVVDSVFEDALRKLAQLILGFVEIEVHWCVSPSGAVHAGARAPPFR